MQGKSQKYDCLKVRKQLAYSDFRLTRVKGSFSPIAYQCVIIRLGYYKLICTFALKKITIWRKIRLYWE